ncbi:ATP-binding protein [Rhizobium laguerreae]|uniref:hypothetical protein n=1 Tax=Rhizobium laguerreae TaxID=1076926 RepID=UPI001C91B526|nr:hypothetical protein [Rhizobium laguerreae]MBY3332822.1 ATP-binding protein [Rhizobium laguerreae]
MSQSSELAGGEGFTYEGSAAAYYLAALLAETDAPGMTDRIVHRVAVQQRDFGEPLDDVIVDFRGATGDSARLSLQVKRSLTISDAASNNDFRDIVRDSWATLAKQGFRVGVDRYGAAVGTISAAKARALTTLCELARESPTTEHFEARFASSGNAGPDVRAVRDDVASVLKDMKGSSCSAEDLHLFLAHFVLIEFDFLHEGAADPSAAISSLRNSLVPSDAGKASLIWSKLIEIARASAGKSGVFYRPRLVRLISPIARIRGAVSLRSDLDILSEFATSLVQGIQDDVIGTKIEREKIAANLDEKLSSFRVVQIRGLPGSGKSVLLRRSVERSIALGPVLFLKGDQLVGKSWRSFATGLGLSSASLHDLLVEIAAAGTGIFYVDAIDRVEKEHQPIILEILRTIVGSSLLDNWRVVLSLRDTGIEPIRNWMGDLVDGAGVGTVEVGPLNDDEAEQLASEKPHLHSLLFGTTQVREIVRRPFFAKILSQNFSASPRDSTFAPQSEVDLIENWWARGGYNADGQDALERQRAIVELAGVRARNLSQPIALARLSPSCMRQITFFAGDGILHHVRQGHSVRFAHDIFFEWAFFHALTDRGEDWLAEVRECGEPPAVARVVELLSQSEYSQKQDWIGHLRRAAASQMRSQWTRSWLLGPVGAANFAADENQFEEAAFADGFQFLKKALVWFQAEKTTPNPTILGGDLSRETQLRYADLLGWPSDFAAWGRFISFLLRRLSRIAPTLYPDVLAVFEVWQNALAGIRNGRSREILTQCARWVEELDARDRSKGQSPESTKWNDVTGLGDFRKSLGSLILRAAISEPDFATKYLEDLVAGERIRAKKFEEIIGFAPTLAQSHPEPLVRLTLKYLKEELPDERVAREREETSRASERRKRALAKPEAERSREDELAIAGAFSRIGYQQFDYNDWQTLSIDRDSRDFFPPSPLREPFHSLFQSVPGSALLLLRELSNHAMAAWRQLHRHTRESHGTPLSLKIAFPWGTQEFWGGDREYLWFRSTWAPKPLGCAFMALEEWCVAELGRGRRVDDLIKEIVGGNECIAILGVAAMVAMHEDTISDSVLPLVTSQRLLAADHNRLIQDLTSGFGNLIGFDGRSDKAHIDLIQAANAREIRKKQLCWLLQRFYMLGGEEMAKKTRAAVLAFKDALPFQIEEHRELPAAIEHLSLQADEYAELVDADYYRAYKTDNPDQVAIVHVSPSALEPEQMAKADRARLHVQEGNLWTWATKAFEQGKLGDGLTVASAIELARRLDSADLFVVAEQEDGGSRRGAIAGAAAIALRFREELDPVDVEWARSIMHRAVDAPEKRDAMWSSRALIPWHHATFASRGLAADLSFGTADGDASTALLNLVAHPLDVVSLAAIEEASKLSEHDPRLSWAALHLGFTLCHVTPRPTSAPRGPSDPVHSFEEAAAAAAAAVAFYNSKDAWRDLPLPPPAWIKVGEADAKGLRYHRPEDEHNYDYDDGESEVWAEPPDFWYHHYADKILPLIPLTNILGGPARTSFLGFAAGLLSWTNLKNEPPGKMLGRRDGTAASLFEWTHGLGEMLGRMAGMIPPVEVMDRFLTPMCALHGEACWSIVAPFVNTFICEYVYDAATIPEGTIELLDACLSRLLASPELDPAAYRSGNFSGFDQPRLAKHLMFISIERADLAARYVNGDWSEVDRIAPIIDRFIRAAGWSSSVMGSFLTLCERAKANYSAEEFADQVLATLLEGTAKRKGWHGTLLPARIAGLVQDFVDRDSPLPLALAQKYLRILDLLVDMGDRRSAALQFSEAFREIRISY